MNNSLVLLAIQTNDPVIYALALSQCGDLDQDSGPCQALSWEHWANIDPDNAVPWLGIAAKASRSGDQEGVDHALAMASMASRFDEYASTVSAIALSALPRDMGPLEKAVAVGDVFSSLSSLGAPSTPGIFETLCSDTAIQQPGRKQQCTFVANDLADKGATLFDVLVASKLAKRLGFSADQQSMLEMEARDDLAALTAHNPWSLTDEGSGYKLASTNFRCNTVLGYDNLVDALQAANGNWRAAFDALGHVAPSAKWMRVWRCPLAEFGHKRPAESAFNSPGPAARKRTSGPAECASLREHVTQGRATDSSKANCRLQESPSPRRLRF